MGHGPFNHASGLFLAAPRRAGKSTFMRDDLIPALIQRDVITTDVDLWADRQRDPASLLSDAVRPRSSPHQERRPPCCLPRAVIL